MNVVQYGKDKRHGREKEEEEGVVRQRKKSQEAKCRSGKKDVTRGKDPRFSKWGDRLERLAGVLRNI